VVTSDEDVGTAGRGEGGVGRGRAREEQAESRGARGVPVAWEARGG